MSVRGQSTVGVSVLWTVKRVRVCKRRADAGRDSTLARDREYRWVRRRLAGWHLQRRSELPRSARRWSWLAPHARANTVRKIYIHDVSRGGRVPLFSILPKNAIIHFSVDISR